MGLEGLQGMKTVRLGLIGCGTWGQNYLFVDDTSYPQKKEGLIRTTELRAPRFSFTHVSRVRASVEAKIGKGPAFANLERVSDWRDMSDAPVDGVVVATPPSSHAELCEHFLSRGIPVMVEKPLTLDVASSLDVARLAEKSGVPFLVNNVHLFSPFYEGLRNLFLSGAGPASILSRGRGHGPFRAYPALFDYGPHDLSMCLGLGLGPPVLVSSTKAPDGDGFIHRVELRFPKSKSRAVLEFGNGLESGSEKERRFEVLREGTWLSYSSSGLRENGRPVQTRQYGSLDNAVTQFARAVSTGEVDWRFGSEVAVQSLRVLQKASG